MNIHKFNVSVIILNQMPGKILKYHTHEKKISARYLHIRYMKEIEQTFTRYEKSNMNKFPFPKNAFIIFGGYWHSDLEQQILKCRQCIFTI